MPDAQVVETNGFNITFGQEEVTKKTNPFQASPTSIALGIGIGFVAFPGWIGNLVVFVIIISQGFLKKSSPVIYKLVASLAVSDFIQLSISIFYLAPSSCLQNWLLPEQLISIPGDIFLVNWYHNWFMFSFIAINRYIAVCRFARYKTTFTHKRTIFCVVFSWILAVATWTHFLWVPCCRFYVSFIVFSYMWEPKSRTEVNWGDYFIEWPGNAGSTIVMAICYAMVLRKIRETSRNLTRSQSSHQETLRRAREVRLSIQFFAISVVYFLVWAMFRICPVAFGATSLELYAVVALLVIINSSINPLIYLTCNEALRKKFNLLMGRNLRALPQHPVFV